MAFEATKREWGELYAFFRLLADGYVYAGTPDVKRNEVQKLPVAMVQREEHDGTRRYILEDEATVRICGEKIDKQIPRGDFAAVAELVFAAVKESRENDVMSPDGVEEFLDEVAIYDLEAKTDDRTDFYVAFYSIEAPLVGFCVRSRLGTMFPLLDGGRAANLKFEQTGVKFATPTVNKINAFGEEDDVAGRMLMIERLGGILKYNDVADKVFRSNLCMIDLHFPRMLGEMLRVMHLDGISKVSDLTEAIKQINPLDNCWSLTERPGFLRLRTGRVVDNLFLAPNTLTQRMSGPKCSGVVAMDVSKMKEGDVAGFSAFNGLSGVLAVVMENGKKQWVMSHQSVSLSDREKRVTAVEVLEKERIDCEKEVVYLRMEGDFADKKDEATFYYSYDKKTWKRIGEPCKMVFDYTKFFMGSKFAIFNYATKDLGGYVDIDYFEYGN